MSSSSNISSIRSRFEQSTGGGRHQSDVVRLASLRRRGAGNTTSSVSWHKSASQRSVTSTGTNNSTSTGNSSSFSSAPRRLVPSSVKLVARDSERSLMTDHDESQSGTISERFMMAWYETTAEDSDDDE